MGSPHWAWVHYPQKFTYYAVDHCLIMLPIMLYIFPIDLQLCLKFIIASVQYSLLTGFSGVLLMEPPVLNICYPSTFYNSYTQCFSS